MVNEDKVEETRNTIIENKMRTIFFDRDNIMK